MSLYENTIKIYTQYDYELCDISNEANIKLLKLRLDFKEKINPRMFLRNGVRLPNT